MGGADVVPGVSGGTIAFITGIYEELLASIKAVDVEAFKLLFSGKFSSFWTKINGTFLVVLVGGILVSIFSLATLMAFLLDTYPIQTWSFFFGLIIIATLLVVRQVRKWSSGVVIALVVGAVAAYFITELTPAETPDDYLFVLLSGAIAICAMILPGISGSFILLILGKYRYIVNAVRDADIGVIVTFGIGCVLGLLSFSRIISWVFEKYHNVAIAVLSGFMIGSLNKIWPWKIVDSFRLDRHGEQIPFMDHNVLPGQFAKLSGADPHWLQAILFAATGILIVVGIERAAAYLKVR